MVTGLKVLQWAALTKIGGKDFCGCKHLDQMQLPSLNMVSMYYVAHVHVPAHEWDEAPSLMLQNRRTVSSMSTENRVQQ